MTYNKLVETYFFAPQHVGIVDLAMKYSTHWRCGEVGRGDVFDLYLRCDRLGKIIDARFKAFGNPFLVAALEWVCEQLQESFIMEHPKFNFAELLNTLAIPKTRYSVALQVEDAYRAVVQKMQINFKEVNYERCCAAES